MVRDGMIGLVAMVVLGSALVACGGEEGGGAASEGARPLGQEEIQELVRKVGGPERDAALKRLREGVDATNMPNLESAVRAARARADVMKDGAMRMGMLRPGHPRNDEVRRDAAAAEVSVRLLEALIKEVRER
jgi:hypothetical protein